MWIIYWLHDVNTSFPGCASICCPTSTIVMENTYMYMSRLLFNNQCCDLEICSRGSSALEFILSRSPSWSRDLKAHVSVSKPKKPKVSVLVSRPEGPGLGLGLNSRDLKSKISVMVSRPRIGLGLKTTCLVRTPVARSLAQTLSICHLWLPINSVVISRPWSRDSGSFCPGLDLGLETWGCWSTTH